MRLLPLLLVVAALGLGCARLHPDDFSHKGGTYATINAKVIEDNYDACRRSFKADADIFQEADARTQECYIQRCMTAKGYVYNGMIDWCTDR